MADPIPADAQLAVGLVSKFMTGKNRKKFLELVKEEVPQANIPEIDAAKPVSDEVDKIRKEFEEFKKEVANRETDRSIGDRFTQLQAARGYMDEAIGEIKKLMVDRNIPDIDAAAALYDRQQAAKAPPPLPDHGYMGSRVFDSAADANKKWFEDPDGMTDLEIGNVLSESRSGRLAA